METDPFSTEIEVRFRDLDPQKHVNNAVYATYLEQARSKYYAEVVETDLEEVGTAIVDLTISYERPILLGEEVVVDLWIPELGESSIPMEYVVWADDDRAATAETVQVHFDPETGRSTPIPEVWRERIGARHGL